MTWVRKKYYRYFLLINVLEFWLNCQRGKVKFGDLFALVSARCSCVDFPLPLDILLYSFFFFHFHLFACFAFVRFFSRYVEFRKYKFTFNVFIRRTRANKYQKVKREKPTRNELFRRCHFLFGRFVSCVQANRNRLKWQEDYVQLRLNKEKTECYLKINQIE